MRLTIITGFFLPVPPLAGGATERSWYGLAKHFAKAGHEVTFVSRQWPGLPDSEQASSVRHVRLKGFGHRRSLAANLLLDLLWGVRVTRKLPAADIVICNTIALPVWLGWIRRSAGKVVVLIGRMPKGQTLLYQKVPRVYVPSSSVLPAVVPRSVASRTRVVGYPIEWGILARGTASDSKVLSIGYVGRLHAEKGLALLIRAAIRLSQKSDLPAWRLVITGPSSVPQGGGGEAWLSELKELAASLGSRVVWRAPVFGMEELAATYRSLDIFCYPSVSEHGETFGVAVAEAMAAGCAVVVSGLECFRDLVKDGQTGLVFDHKGADPAGPLALALESLLTDRAARERLANSGREASRAFDYPEVASKMLADFAVLTGETRRNQP